jgi:hypothetical protein
MSNIHVTYVVGAGCGVIALAAFISLVLVPALQSYRRGWERAAAVVLSAYVLAAFVGVGVVLGAWIVLQWPNWF